MKIVKYLLLSNLLCGTLFSQNFEIAHPYREIDFTSNGFTTNGSKIYISTVYDGHLYEFDFSDPEQGLVDRFRVYSELKIYPGVGSPIYLPDQDKLYVGSTWGNLISIFENIGDKRNTENLPEKTLAIENESIAYLYRPQRAANNIYWGCYHSDKNAGAKIVKFDIRADTTSVINFDQIEKANYTHSLAIAGGFLYAGTENGHIIKYNLRTERIDTNIIDLGTEEKVYYLTSDGSNLYAMLSQNKHSFFKIENPAGNKPRITQIKQSGYKLSRIFYHDNFIYGSTWKYNILEDLITPCSYNIKMLGGINYDGKTYLIGVRNDEISRPRKKNITSIEASTSISTVFSPQDIASKEIGAELQTIAASEYSGKLYMSTYWVGAMYEYDQRIGSEELKPDISRHNQADVIKVYNNYVLFGCYGGERDAYLLRYNTLANRWKRLELDNDLKNNAYTSRITAITRDPESGKTFFGSGDQSINKSTKNAVLCYLPVIRSLKFINIDYDDRYLDDPIRFVSLKYYDNCIYGVTYNRKMEHNLFKLDISDLDNPKFMAKRALGFLGKLKGFRDKMLHQDDNILVCGAGRELYIFDLDNFQIADPGLIIKYEEEVGDIVSDDNYYYVSFRQQIKVYAKNDFRLISTLNAELEKQDKIHSIEVLNSKLFAITAFGRLYHFDTDF
jgi:hypothetical protein